ncbi:trypsin-like peptidase domain-containing protein [Gordonia sp. DT219]|uniref:S1C family serine protease n=1 Tax=Gordonia sp. DT219 TaxID=3416658 RepID=UPI003CF6F74B
MTTDRHPDNNIPDGSDNPVPSGGTEHDPVPPDFTVPAGRPAGPTGPPVGTAPDASATPDTSAQWQHTAPFGAATPDARPAPTDAHGPHPYATSPLGQPYPGPAATGQLPPGPPPFSPMTTMAPPPGGPRRSSMKPIIATALIAGLLGGAVALGGSALVGHTTGSAPQLGAPAAATAAPAQPGSVTYAAQAASKFTADIEVSAGQGTAIGSGIVLSPDGYVLTNNHVVAGVGDGATIRVTTADQKTYAGSVVGTSPSYDLAVVKLANASGLPAAALGNSDGLQVGQQVVAVGSPENLSNTVTSGIISNLSRTVTAGDEQGSQVTVYNGLQTDTAINPGNSGGPLVNLSGQVIGVNSAVDTGSDSQGGVQAFGLGFAIPVNTARRVANELLADGHATKPVLGVTGSLQDTDTGATTGGGTAGARVTGVQSGSAADAAGISAGDVITKVGDERVTGYADLMAQILTHQPGQTVPVTVSRGGQERTVTVKLGSAVDTAQTTVPSTRGTR